MARRGHSEGSPFSPLRPRSHSGISERPFFPGGEPRPADDAVLHEHEFWAGQSRWTFSFFNLWESDVMSRRKGLQLRKSSSGSPTRMWSTKAEGRTSLGEN